MKNRVASAFSAFIILFGFHGMARAATVFVDVVDDHAFVDKCSLRSAISSVNANSPINGCKSIGEGAIDTIKLLPGTYGIFQSPLFSGELFPTEIFADGRRDDDANEIGDLDIIKSVKIVGAGRDATVLKVPNGPMRVLHVNPKGESDVRVEISDLTLQDGNVQNLEPGGGCLLNNKANLKLVNISVKNCKAVEGLGGALYNARGNVTIEGSSFFGNQSELSGGGLLNDQGTMAINNSTISGNKTTEARGGGIFNAKGTLKLINATLSDNESRFSGGGLYNFDGKVTAVNATIVFNQADFSKSMLGGGGGIVSTDAGEVQLANTILAKNRAWSDEEPDCLGNLTSQGHNILGNIGSHGTCLMTAATGDQIGSADKSLDPKLMPAKKMLSGNEIYIPLGDSPAVDLADASLCPPTDERGTARPQEGGCDIGAIERLKYEMLDSVKELSATMAPPPAKFEAIGMIKAEQPPFCGNGVVEKKEDCDHGAKNGTPGDSCSSTCHDVGTTLIESFKPVYFLRWIFSSESVSSQKSTAPVIKKA